MILNELIKEYRWAKRMTTRELAHKIGLLSSTISRIENNKPMDGSTLSKILIWLLSPYKEKE